MKHTKIIALLSVAAFVLTGCKKTCSKEEFIELANKTEVHQYKKASATYKGKLITKSGAITQTYEPDETIQFEYKNGSWKVPEDFDYDSLMGLSLVASCLVVVSMNVRDIVKDDETMSGDQIEKITFYSSPFGFSVKSNFKDYKQSTEGLNIILNGKSDAEYTFDSNNGVILSYSEKSDLDTEITYDTVTSKSNTITDIKIEIEYSD